MVWGRSPEGPRPGGVTRRARLEDAVLARAPCYAEPVPREARKRLVVFVNLEEVAPPNTLAAAIADRRLTSNATSGDEV